MYLVCRRTTIVDEWGVTHAKDHAEREEHAKGEHVDEDVGP